MLFFSFIYQYDHTQYITFTKIIEWTILLCPFIIFFIFLIKDFYSKDKIISKKYDNITKKEIVKELFKRKKERQKTHQSKFINIQRFTSEERKNSSFTCGHRSSYINFSNEELDIENDSNKPKIDSIINYENNIFVSESNTRKPTIEMQIIDKK